MLVLATLMLACGESQPTDTGPARNVVLVSLDTLRADHLGLYGYARDTSPELDAFAREAFVFEREVCELQGDLHIVEIVPIGLLVPIRNGVRKCDLDTHPTSGRVLAD